MRLSQPLLGPHEPAGRGYTRRRSMSIPRRVPKAERPAARIGTQIGAYGCPRRQYRPSSLSASASPTIQPTASRSCCRGTCAWTLRRLRRPGRAVATAMCPS